MKSGTFNMMRQLMEENIALTETGKRSGFLRDNYRINDGAVIQNMLSKAGSIQGVAYFNAVARMDKLLKICTAEEYACLTECTFTSSKDFVKMYIDTLVKLYDAGLFDINAPNYFAASPINPPYPNEIQEDMKKFTIPEGAVLLGQPQPTLGDDSWTKKGHSEKYELPEGAVLTHQEPCGKMLKKDPKTGRFYEVDDSEENKEQSEDNSGKPYNGPVLEINFTGDTDDVNRMASIFHNALCGKDDYINTNIIVSNNNNESASITVCLNDLKHPVDIISAMSKMFVSDKTLGFLGYVSEQSRHQESVPTTSNKVEKKK